MAFIRWPSSVRSPWTEAPDDRILWTPQQGGGSLSVTVVGADPDAPAAPPPILYEEKLTEFPLRDYQEAAVRAVEAAYRAGKKAPLIVLPTGCHRAGQKLLMFDGSIKAVEDVVVGDQLMGPDSTPRTVLQLCRGTGPMVTITPTKGVPWVVNDEHILSLVTTDQGSRPSERAREYDISVRDYESRSKWFKHIAKLFRVPVTFPERPHGPISPYFMGLYLADGTLAVKNVGVTKPDPEVRDACYAEAARFGLFVRPEDSNGTRCVTWCISSSDGVNPIAREFARMGLWPCASEDRFIPNEYKLGSIEVRRELLAGILDGDGHLSNGIFDASWKSKRFANDVAFVARSLGLAAYVEPTTKSCQNDFTGDYWRMAISGDFAGIKLRIPRKQPRPRLQKKDVRRTGFTVTRTGTVEPYFGFTLDGDQRYLLDDFTVTHNSGKTILSAALMQRSFDRWSAFRGYKTALVSRCLFLAHRRELLDQTYDKVHKVADHLRVGICQGGRNDLTRDITVASIDTLAYTRAKKTKTGKMPRSRLDEVIAAGPYHLIICDEAHHAVSPKWRTVLDALRTAFPEALVLGMTATPGRDDGVALDEVFDTIAYQMSLHEAIMLGALVPPRQFRVRVDVEFDRVEVDGETKDFKRPALSKLMNTPPVNQAVVRAWQEYGQDRKMLAFAVDVAHSHALAEAFSDEGVTALAIDGKMLDADREAALRSFRSGATKILVSCEVLLEGFDEPSAEGIIFARPTMSQALYIQAIGRGLRLHPMKEDCLILDIVGNSEKHRLVQLASLVGFNPETGGGNAAGDEDEILVPEATAEVIDANIRDVREIPMLRRLPGRYTWRDTSFGWILQIPRIGYYLISPHGQADGRVMVRFYDRRSGRENTPPREVLSAVSFEFAHGLVEAEMGRLVRGLSGRSDEGAAPPIAGLMSVDDGTEQLSFAETLVLQDQDWHEKPPTSNQRRLMLNLGIKERSFPETAGEAAELIDIVRTERDMRRRQPATAAQLRYLRSFMIPLPEGSTPETLTKAEATKLIVQHKFHSGTT